MIQKELGFDPEPPDTPFQDALYVGLSYLGAAIIPLFPYFFISGAPAIITSILLTFVALFGIGLLKGKFASLPYIKSGLQVLLVGAGSGIGGYFLGTLLPRIVGV
jgi:VIT1/CCC1 family predicted Fe2+/Mn2+ transporter